MTGLTRSTGYDLVNPVNPVDPVQIVCIPISRTIDNIKQYHKRYAQPLFIINQESENNVNSTILSAKYGFLMKNNQNVQLALF